MPDIDYHDDNGEPHQLTIMMIMVNLINALFSLKVQYSTDQLDNVNGKDNHF